MILHCKNAEMTILLSFLHFYGVKSYNFIVISTFLRCKIIQFLLFFFLLFFFSIWQFSTSEKNKKGQFFFSLNAKIWVGGSVNQEIKKKSPNSHYLSFYWTFLDKS